MGKIRQMKAKIEDDELVIRVPLALMKHAFENNPEYIDCDVVDIKKMGRYVAKHILKHSSQYEAPPDITDILDRLFYQAVDDAEPWVKVTWRTGGHD